MPKHPEILAKKIVARSRLFLIEEVHLRFENGEERYFERLVSRNNGAVVIVPLLLDKEFLLVREYAAGVDRYELGFPKGLVGLSEDPLVAANRELMEEIGYGAKDLKILTRLTVSPGYWGSCADVILARDLYSANLPGDEPEPLEIVPWPVNKYKELLEREDFTEARSVAALLLVKEMLAC